jgi:hypothetical protein
MDLEMEMVERQLLNSTWDPWHPQPVLEFYIKL